MKDYAFQRWVVSKWRWMAALIVSLFVLDIVYGQYFTAGLCVVFGTLVVLEFKGADEGWRQLDCQSACSDVKCALPRDHQGAHLQRQARP